MKRDSVRGILHGTGPIVITCPRGLSGFLNQELLSLGFPVVSVTVAGAVTEGTFHDAMRLNLSLRTGHRVLLLIGEFRAKNPDQLYRALFEIAWEEYIDEGGRISVTSAVDNPTIRDTRYVNQRCKDAIVDRIRQKRGRRPDSGPERDGAVIHVYWKGENCSAYFDTSGEPLARRGYRKIPLDAPMQETLAAAVVIATGWEGKDNFINPMCGSGTLAIEAALIAARIAPGLLRRNFAFMHLKGFERLIWDDLCAEAKEKIRRTTGRIVATDLRAVATESGRENARFAGVEDLIEFETCDFRETAVPRGGGVVVINPEYGLRMGKADELGEIYRGMGDFFKQRCAGYRGFIFTGNPTLAKKVGLRTKRRVQFFNGEVECRLLEYELYEGSRKTGTNTQEKE